MEKTLPTIDMQGFPKQYEQLRSAGENWGCFRLANHNISSSLMSEMKSVIGSLFELPMEIKQRNSDEIPGTGHIPPNQFNPLFESLGFYDLGSSEAVQKFCSQLDATSHQREVIETYTKAIHEMTVDLARKLGESLGFRRSEVFEKWVCQFRINQYKFTPETVGSSGLQIHTDYGFITILQDDENVGGLEVMDKSGEFVTVNAVPGTLLVNLGDVAKAWSNGRLHSVKHRVVSKKAAVRVSTAAFLLGPKGANVEAPPELVDSDHPRLYNSFIYEEHRQLRMETKLHAGEALEFMRIKSA